MEEETRSETKLLKRTQNRHHRLDCVFWWTGVVWRRGIGQCQDRCSRLGKRSRIERDVDWVGSLFLRLGRNASSSFLPTLHWLSSVVANEAAALTALQDSIHPETESSFPPLSTFFLAFWFWLGPRY